MRDLSKKVDSIFEAEKKQYAHGTVYTAKILSDISKGTPSLKRLDSWSLADGSVGLFRYEDGNAYEIEVRPIQSGKWRSLWGDKVKKRQERKPTDEWMMTPEGVGEVPPAVNNPGNISYYKSVD